MTRDAGEKGEPGSGGSDRSDGSVGSDRSDGFVERGAGGTPGRPGLRASGGYRELRSFQVATVVYDATVAFCERFLDRRSRTVDQMVQAARSGRQNIAEGSRAAAASSQTELRLISVARASLDELLLDYEDFLRQRGMALWAKEDPEARAVRAVGWLEGRAGVVSGGDRTDRTDRTDPAKAAELAAAAYAAWLYSADPAVVANTIICLIHQSNYLLDRQLAALERQFVREGGYSERLAAARIAERARQQREGPAWEDRADGTDRTDPTDGVARGRPETAKAAAAGPACPRCGGPMGRRTARQGARAGSEFWGCSAYPACRGTREA